MNSRTSNAWVGGVLLASLLLVTGGCQRLKARDEMRKGVENYTAGRYDAAIENFKIALQADPELLNAQLYLATTYTNKYVPGSEEENNLKIAEQAITEFQAVLQKDPNNVASIASLANLFFQMKRLDEAKEYYRKQIAADPANAGGYYMVGVINWSQVYQPRIVLKTRLRLKPEDPIKDVKEREALAERNNPLIDEGMDMLNKAMGLRPDYDDAMAYVNLLYREKADLVATPTEREEFLKTADEWIAKSLAIKKKRQTEEAAKQSEAS